MVRIRILRGRAAAGFRSLRATGVGGLLVGVAILFASLGSLGEDRDGSASSSSSSVAPIPVEPFGVPPVASAAVVETEEAGRDQPAAGIATEGNGTRPKAREGNHPDHLLQLPSSAESALVFDLQDNRMHLFTRTGEHSRSAGDFFVAVGKNGIEKRREGDEKTPIGIYFISSYISGESLPAIYGAGAFPINYPNTWDRRLGRTGSGIWIHGTDKDAESLLPQSSRGCLTLHNADFLTMAQSVRIRYTPVIVSDAVRWTSPARLAADRDSLASAIETWRRDWESLDTDSYLRHYSEAFRTDSMSLASWTAHKRRVNASKRYIRIGVDDVGIYRYPGEPELFLVTFDQGYESDNFKSRKWKQQYWRREDGDWRIVHEGGI